MLRASLPDNIMEIKIYQVDAFTNKLFSGNPAAVCPLEAWLPDKTLQAIALENNLAETAYYVHGQAGLRIRWFTPGVEVDLCGHATLAAAFVLFHHEGFNGDTITFDSRSGPLAVTRKEQVLTLNFPVDKLHETVMPPDLINSMNIQPRKVFQGKTDYMLVYDSESQIRELFPDFALLGKVAARGVIATARGEKVDFVSRFFAPQCGINEDPVTGSAHTSLIPYWAKVLGKNDMSALQCSSRGGELICSLKGERVEIGGSAKLFMIGKIFIG